VKVALVASVLVGTFTVAAGNAGTSCSEVPASIKEPIQLGAAISASRLASLRLWSAADGASPAADHCEEVMWHAFGRLVELRTDAASKQAAALLLDPALSWNAGDAVTAADQVARLGVLVKPYLEPHAKTSRLAAFTLKCIAEGRKTCM